MRGSDTAPRVILGMPAYDRPDTLARTIESLLSQTYTDFALVIMEDNPSAATAPIAQPYVDADRRVHYEVNESRLGMVGNWRKVFERATQLYPRAEYFAWVSDHDLWHARWLQELVAVLDAQPDVVLAYVKNMRMMPGDGRMTDKVFETVGVRDRAERMRRSARYMLSGDMIYGLMRVRALNAAGVFRAVTTPDRQVLLALSLFGQVRQLPEVLWYREVLRVFDVGRQRAVFFPDGAPLYIYLPAHLQHFATFVWDFAIRGAGAPEFGRLAGARYAISQLWWSYVRDIERPKSDLRTAMSEMIGGWRKPRPRQAR